MKRSADQQSVRLSDHGAFFSYRWVAWVIAALALTLPGHPAATLPRDAGLLLLIGVINVVATALAQSYVRIARQRPALLALDLVAGAAVLWLSGSAYLPFLPYALAALVLPAIIFGWRGALIAAGAFVALDLVGLTLINPRPYEGEIGLALRLLAPLAFAGCWVAASRFAPRIVSTDSARSGGSAGAGAGQAGRQAEAGAGLQPSSPPADRSRPEGATPVSTNLAVPGPIVMLRAAPEQHPNPTRRVLYDLTPAQDVSLLGALGQLAAAAQRQGELIVRVASAGEARALHPAHHSVLLRVAQEALLNVQQHARAHTVMVSLAYESAAVTLVVHDDGVGLLDGTYERPGLHALRALRYRLAELEGQLVVFENEDGGVTVRATLPRE